MDKPEKIDNYNHLLYSAITISIGVFMAALATVKVYVNVFHDGPYSTDPAVWGQLGDYIGGVLNPVIGLATLFMLLINIRLQQKELQNSKIELHDTKLAMDIQAKEMKVQNIEQSFFSMLSNYRSQLDLVFTEEIIGSAFNHNQQRITVTGRRALNALWKSRMAWSTIIDTIKNKYQSEEDPKLPLHNILNAVDQPVGFGDAAINYLHSSIELQWHCFVTDNHFQTETLFQIISSLVEWIDGHAVLTEGEKKQYVSIVIAQLSSVEIQIFFLYSLKNYEKRMNLFTKYRFFKNLDSKQRALAFVKQYGMNANSYSSEAFDVF